MASLNFTLLVFILLAYLIIQSLEWNDLLVISGFNLIVFTINLGNRIY